MTALNWKLATNQVVILCDSLMLSADDHRPLSMVTKVYSLPHIGLCIAGTGVQPLAEKLWARANSHCVARDICQLNEIAPSILQSIWGELLQEPSFADLCESGLTGTVYLYGWSEDAATFVGYAYRSPSGFASEPLKYGIAIKPAPNSGKIPLIDGLDDLLGVLREQKREDRERPRRERVGIGGDVILTLMTRDEAAFTIIEQRAIFRFEDFENDWSIILAKLPNNAGSNASIIAISNDP